MLFYFFAWMKSQPILKPAVVLWLLIAGKDRQKIGNRYIEVLVKKKYYVNI